jgi:hypothetical protein
VTITASVAGASDAGVLLVLQYFHTFILDTVKDRTTTIEQGEVLW